MELMLSSGATKSVSLLINAPPSRPGEPPSPLATNGLAVLLGPGASGVCDTPVLDALAEGMALAGVPVLRYAGRGTSVAHRADVVSALMDAAEEGRVPGLAAVRRWVASGHSMGARVAAVMAARRANVVACLLLSYPLVPPGATLAPPERSRPLAGIPGDRQVQSISDIYSYINHRLGPGIFAPILVKVILAPKQCALPMFPGAPGAGRGRPLLAQRTIQRRHPGHAVCTRAVYASGWRARPHGALDAPPLFTFGGRVSKTGLNGHP